MSERRTKMRYGLLGILIVTLVAGGIVFSHSSPPTPQDVKPQVGFVAPDFTLPTLDGPPLRLSTLRGQKAVFINFWATWCVPCRIEMPTMEKAYQKYKGQGLEILAISVDVGNPTPVRTFVQELRLTFPILLDPRMEIPRLYRVNSLPASFLVNRSGVIVVREIGSRDWTTREADALLHKALQ